LLAGLRRALGTIGAATAAATAALAASALWRRCARSEWFRLLQLGFAFTRRTRRTRLLLATLFAALALAASALAAGALLRLLGLLLLTALALAASGTLTALAPRLLAAAATLLLARSFARPLLELADLLVHVAARLVLRLEADLVMPAVRAALPAFRVGLLAGGAGDAFWQRHRESARIVHFRRWTTTAAGRC
jgi:hypothetical protein